MGHGRPARRGRVRLHRLGATVLSHVPAPVAVAGGRLAGRASSYTMPAKRRMVARHMRRASGGTLSGLALHRAVSGAFDSYGRYWVELLGLPGDVRRGRAAGRIVVDGFEHVEAARAAGRGAVVALPHLGGWEYAGPYLAARGIRPLAVAEPLDPPELFNWFATTRAVAGIDVIALGPDAAPRLAGALRENRVVTLVCDRDLTGDGVEVSFFGERTTVPAGPALLALRTGADLLPTAVYFERGTHHRGVVRPPLPVERSGRLRDDVARLSQRIVDELEILIAAAPEQWHLLQPNWPSDRAVAS